MQPNEILPVPEDCSMDNHELNAIRGGTGGQTYPDRDPDDDLLIPD